MDPPAIIQLVGLREGAWACKEDGIALLQRLRTTAKGTILQQIKFATIIGEAASGKKFLAAHLLGLPLGAKELISAFSSEPGLWLRRSPLRLHPATSCGDSAMQQSYSTKEVGCSTHTKCHKPYVAGLYYVHT